MVLTVKKGKRKPTPNLMPTDQVPKCGPGRPRNGASPALPPDEAQTCDGGESPQDGLPSDNKGSTTDTPKSIPACESDESLQDPASVPPAPESTVSKSALPSALPSMLKLQLALPQRSWRQKRRSKPPKRVRK